MKTIKHSVTIDLQTPDFCVRKYAWELAIYGHLNYIILNNA